MRCCDALSTRPSAIHAHQQQRTHTPDACFRYRRVGGPTAWMLPNQGIMGAEFQTTRRLLLVVVHGPLPTFNIRYRVEQSSFTSFTSLFHSIISAISSPPSFAPLPSTGRRRRFFSLALIVRSSSSTAHSSHCKLRPVEHIVSQCLLLRPTVLQYYSFPIFNPYSFLSY